MILKYYPKTKNTIHNQSINDTELYITTANLFIGLLSP